MASLSQEGKKKKVLFVDDEPDLTKMLKLALESFGFTIDTFNDPVLALESFKPSHYDLVILDIMMPKMDGFELYTRLKKVDPGIKICFLTASSSMYWEELRKEKYSDLNRELFVELPLPTNEIIAEIKKRMGLS